MNCGGDAEGKLVERVKEAKNPSQKRADNDGGNAIPDEKHKNATFFWFSFAPSNF